MKLEVSKVVEILKSKFKFSDPDKTCGSSVGWVNIPHASHVKGININCGGNVLHVSTAFYFSRINPVHMAAIQNIIMNEMHGIRVFELQPFSSNFINESGVTIGDNDQIMCIDIQSLIPLDEVEFDLTGMLGFMIESIARSKDLFDNMMNEIESNEDKSNSNVIPFKPNKFKS